MGKEVFTWEDKVEMKKKVMNIVVIPCFLFHLTQSRAHQFSPKKEGEKALYHRVTLTSSLENAVVLK